MGILHEMARLALQPLVKACKAIPPGTTANNPPHSLASLTHPDARLLMALQRASRQTWAVLQVLLAGRPFWEGCHLFLDLEEWQALHNAVHGLLPHTPLSRLGPIQRERVRIVCARELQMALRAGLLSETTWMTGLPRASLFESTRTEPLTRQEQRPLAALGEELRGRQLAEIARFVDSNRHQLALLIEAVQVFFRRELETDAELLPDIDRDRLDGASHEQREAYYLIADTLARYGRGLREWLEEPMPETPPSASNAASAAAPAENAPTRELPAPTQDTAAAEPAAQEAPQTPRQRMLGWLVGVLGLVVPMTLVVWFISSHTASEVGAFTGPTASLESVAVSANGAHVAAASVDGSIHVWEADTPEKPHKLEGHKGAAHAVAFSPSNADLLVSAGADMVRVWDVRARKQTGTIEPPGREAHYLAFTPDGQQLLTASKKDKVIHVWDSATCKLTRSIQGHTGSIYGLALSPSGKWVASASADTTVRIWETSTGKLLHKLAWHAGTVTAVAFSPDEKYVASAGFADNEHKIRLWNAATGEGLQEYRGHRSAILGLAFSPDGKHLASCGMGAGKAEQGSSPLAEKRTLRVWHVERALEVYHFASMSDTVWSVAYAPQTGQLLSAGADQKVRIWSVP